MMFRLTCLVLSVIGTSDAFVVRSLNTCTVPHNILLIMFSERHFLSRSASSVSAKIRSPFSTLKIVNVVSTDSFVE